MPSTYSQILLHFVFSTKHRGPVIAPAIQERLYPYIGGIIRAEGGVLYAIGGMPDHVHLLVRWKTDPSIADLMRTVKGRSAAWVHDTLHAREFAWQQGYAAFSVSKSNEPAVKHYIETQPEHHRHRDFKDELLAMLRAHEIEFDERYVFD